MFREVGLEEFEGALGGHVGHQPHVDLRDRPVRQDRLAAGPGISADQPFDVDRRLRNQPDLGVVPRLVGEPVFHAEGFLGAGFALLRDRGLENLALGGGERLHPVEEALDSRGMAVSLHQSVEGLDEVPDGAVDRGLVARVDVELRPPPPFLSRCHQFQLDHALGAEIDFDRPVGRLGTEGDDDPDALPERRFDFGFEHDLPEVG